MFGSTFVTDTHLSVLLLEAYVSKGTLKAIQNSGKDGSLRYTAAPHNRRLEKGSRGRNEM